jgi:hypothetical protein
MAALAKAAPAKACLNADRVFVACFIAHPLSSFCCLTQYVQEIVCRQFAPTKAAPLAGQISRQRGGLATPIWSQM